VDIETAIAILIVLLIAGVNWAVGVLEERKRDSEFQKAAHAAWERVKKL
jgi:hypothetical protein